MVLNDGFVTIWLLTIGIILYATGWERQVTEGISRRLLAILIGGLLLLQAFELPVGAKLEVKASVVLFLVIVIVWAVLDKLSKQLVYVFATSVFAGLVWLWIRFMYAVDPVFIVLDPGWDGALAAGILAGIMVERFRPQLMVIALASVVAVAADLVRAFSHGEPFTLGALAWWDGLVIAMAAGRLTAGLKGYLRRLGEWVVKLRNRAEQ